MPAAGMLRFGAGTNARAAAVPVAAALRWWRHVRGEALRRTGQIDARRSAIRSQDDARATLREKGRSRQRHTPII